MKNIAKKAAIIVCFLLILFLCISGVYRVLRWKDTTGDYTSSIAQLYNTSENKIDVVFMGSSHCYCGIYPAILWEQQGIAAFDMSVSGQDKNTNYYNLLELLKTQKPKVVLIDTYALLYDRHAVEANEYRNYLSMNWSLNTLKHVSGYVEKERQADFFARFPIIHTRYQELEKYDFVDYLPNDFGRGEYYSWRKNPVSFDGSIFQDEELGELSDSNRDWLDRLMELSEEKDFELQFMYLPSAVNLEEQRIVNAAADYAEGRGYRFIDFNKIKSEVGIDDSTDFVDAFHLNGYGAAKLTEYIGRNLLQTNSLQDHRGDKEYIQWDRDAAWMYDCRKREVMNNTSDPYEYVGNLIDANEFCTVISLEGKFYESQIDYFNLLAPLGMDYDDYLLGGKWLYYNGELTKIMENQEGQTDYLLDLNRYDTLKVGYYGICEDGNIMLNTKTYQTKYALTFLTYDCFLNEIAAHRGF